MGWLVDVLYTGNIMHPSIQQPAEKMSTPIREGAQNDYLSPMASFATSTSTSASDSSRSETSARVSRRSIHDDAENDGSVSIHDEDRIQDGSPSRDDEFQSRRSMNNRTHDAMSSINTGDDASLKYVKQKSEKNKRNKIKSRNGHRSNSRNVAHDKRDQEGIALLSIIFPDASLEELEMMHFGRIHSPSKEGCSEGSTNPDEYPTPKVSRLNALDPQNNGIIHEEKDPGTEVNPSPTTKIRKPTASKPPAPIQKPKPTMKLPDDFLRIPIHQALKLPNKQNGQMEWKTVANLEKRVFDAHVLNDDEMGQALRSDQALIRSTVLTRRYNNSLGIQLCEWNGLIYVNALTSPSPNSAVDLNRIMDEESYVAAVQSGIGWDEFGSAFQAGLRPRDQVLGVNGIPFLRRAINASPHGSQATSGQKIFSSDILADAVNLIRGSDTLVFHIYRMDRNDIHPESIDVANFYSNKTEDGQIKMHHQQGTPTQTIKGKGTHTPRTRSRQSDDDSWTTRSDVSIEKNGWQVVDDQQVPPSPVFYHSYNRRDPKDIHPLIQQFEKKGLTKSKKEQLKLSKELQQLTSRAAQWNENAYLRQSLVSHGMHDPLSRQDDSFGIIDFIRQSICIHIVNTFIEGDRLAYTIWVFDVESGTEWYAPIRYLKDFKELRIATSSLNRTIEKLPFPSISWFNEDESALSQQLKDTRRRQLKDFLRGLCNVAYTENIDESTGEIALFVQTFLGCDAAINSEHEFRRNRMDFDVQDSTSSEERTKTLLKKAIQLYTYRLFLLPPFKSLVERFIYDVERRAFLIETKKRVNLGSGAGEKEKIAVELSIIKDVFGNLWQLIFKGCLEDINAIASCSEFSALVSNLTPANRSVFIEGVFREAVREQIEIEVYVPLRSVVSRLLVFGWRYDDKCISYKIEILRRKSQSFFKISTENQSPSRWQSVIDILSEGVGRSTLPCNKLKAIVEAGKEIGRLSKEEHPDMSADTSLGADDFLPIFIFCVVNAEIERPCALCKFYYVL